MRSRPSLRRLAVDLLEGLRREHVPTADQGAETGRERLNLLLDAIRELLGFALIPGAAELAAGGKEAAQ